MQPEGPMPPRVPLRIPLRAIATDYKAAAERYNPHQGPCKRILRILELLKHEKVRKRFSRLKGSAWKHLLSCMEERVEKGSPEKRKGEMC